MNYQVYPQGQTAFRPRNLAGSLILNKGGNRGRRIVVRDDGDNGLWIAHPGDPANMWYISRAEYNDNWQFERPEGGVEKEDLGEFSFDSRKGPTEQTVDLNHRNETRVSEQETEDMGSEQTDREAMKREILDQNPADETMSGNPVGANEEPADAMEEDRSDLDEAGMEDSEAAAKKANASAKRAAKKGAAKPDEDEDEA